MEDNFVLKTGTEGENDLKNALKDCNRLFVASTITVIYPNISNKVINQDFIGLQRTINNSIVYISLLVIPAVVGSMVLARPIREYSIPIRIQRHRPSMR